MVHEYNTMANNQGIPPSEMFAYAGDLISLKDPFPEAFSTPEFFEFDIAAVGMGFHHFESPTLAAKRLGERLKKGGTLLIVDFAPHELSGVVGGHGHRHDHGHGHSHAHDAAMEGKPSEAINDARETITHHGFSETDVKKMFENAGVGLDFKYQEIGDGVVFVNMKSEGDSMKRSVFMARGTKS